MVVADLRADAIAALVARASVVHRDPGGGLQPRSQHVARFVEKAVMAVDQQTHDLTLGDAEADRLQLFHQPLHRHLALVVLHQHEAAQFRAKMAGYPGRQRGNHGGALRCHPALAAVADHLRAQHQLLHHEGLITFEPRAGWHRRFDHLLLDPHPRRQFAAATPLVPLA